MSDSAITADPGQRKRLLRLRLGRARRRIDGRLRGTQNRGRELLDWRTYARRYPGNVLLGTFGLGLALSAGLGGRSLARWLGMRLLRRGLRQGEQLLGEELRWLWDAAGPNAESTPRKPRSSDVTP